MSDHLFGSITLPPELGQLVGFYRLHVDRGAGTASVLDGWRAFLESQCEVGPMAFLSVASEHLEHFGDRAPEAVEDLIGSPWSEVVSLGVALQSLRFGGGSAVINDQVMLPRWLADIEQRTVVQASVLDESPRSGATPWIVELDFGRDTTSCANVWINPDGSLSQLYPSDETIDGLEAFLREIDPRASSQEFTRVRPAEALRALRAPSEHRETLPGERAMLHWLRRTAPGAGSA